MSSRKLDNERRERQERISAQAEKVAELIGVDPDDIAVDGTYGVVLSPNQLDALLKLASR